jgi:hypothetical protein
VQVPPSTPALTSPSGIIADTTPAYVWNETDDTTAYRIGVYSFSSASYVILTDVDPVICAGGVCTYDPGTVLSAGNYQFKVLSKNAAGASPYSAWTTFTVVTSAPAAPTLVSPSGVITYTDPPYKWNASSGASSYRVGVYSVSSASYVILTEVTASSVCYGGLCTYDPGTVLAAGNYQYKVQGRNPIGYGAWSAWNYFTVMTTAPAVPTLVSPTGVITDTTPSYKWNATTGATAYRIGVYRVSTGTYPILTDVAASACSGGVCTYTPATVLPAGEYKFKVLAKNAIGSSAYSAWMTFTVVTTAPGVPTLVSPSGTISDTTPSYRWNAVSGATAYRIGVYRVSTGTYIILTDVSSSVCSGSVCTYTPSTVLPAGNYQWKVLAKNAIGSSAYSAWRTFTVAP